MKIRFGIIALVLLWLVNIFFPNLVLAANIEAPQIASQPVIKWGNTSYHDSLGARDPWVIKDNGNFYLYYDCSEDLLNPSFENNLGTNGWDTYEAQIFTSSDEHLFGQQSLKMATSNKATIGDIKYGAFTGNYYYQNIRDDAHLAVPTGLEVIPNTKYIASVYVKAHVASSVVGLTVTEYTSDPGFWSNHIEPITNKVTTWASGNWERLSVPFTTLANTRAITISLVTNGNVTSYWDGVQLERVADGQTIPSNFPGGINFNKSLEDTVGWRPCIATSTDGITFQKKGLVEIQEAVEEWQNYVKPGWVGADSIYLNVFPYGGKWYAYTWVAGYPVETGNPYIADSGLEGYRRFGYGDRRAFLPNGSLTRSALLVADSPTGPFQRVGTGGPVINPNNEAGCQASVREGNSPWGCDYIAASGVPQQINNQWVMFLSGQTFHQKGVMNWWGSWGRPDCSGDVINSGIAVGDNPLGPWTPTAFSPLFPAAEVCQNALVPEGPVYYFDKASGNHVIFVNQLADMSITAFWTKSPLATWPVANRKNVVDRQANGTIPNAQGMNLSTVVENGNKLNLYFGYREDNGNTTPGVSNYLFHDIGMLTFDLPLFPAVSSTIEDLRRLLSAFTTIFDYNRLVANYGK